MKQPRTPLIVGNWKMNPTSLAEAKELFIALRGKTRSFTDMTIAVAPPSIYLSDLARLSPSGRINIGAQRIYPEPSGAHTGEISAPMVASAGATYVIIGHSERRAEGIDYTGVATRVRAALRGRLTPILCIGEGERDEDGEFYSTLERQLETALASCKKSEVARMVIAYEPIWAIGSGATPTGADINEMRLFIEKCLTKLFDRLTARKTTILYGGSVKPDNAATLYTEGGVHGFLVGGASLDATSFTDICKAIRQA